MSCVRRPHHPVWPLQAREEHLISILIGPISDTVLIQHILRRPYLCVLPSYFLSPRLRWRILLVIIIITVFWPPAPKPPKSEIQTACTGEMQEKQTHSAASSCKRCAAWQLREVWGSTETYLVWGRQLRVWVVWDRIENLKLIPNISCNF